MNKFIKGLVLVATAWAAAGAGASAQDVGATTSGNWNDPTIWTTGTVPGSSNNVFIGSTTPSGSAPIATVTLTQDQSALNLTLGDGNNTHGTLDLGSHTLNIGNALTIGLSGGLGTVVEGPGGSFTASAVNVESSNSFTFGAKDATAILSVFSGSTATTTAVGNVTRDVNVFSGSTLNLGANLNLGSSGQLDVENTGSVLNMNGHKISAGTILLGQFGDQAVTLNRGTPAGSLTATNLYIAQGTLDLIPADRITNLNLDNGATVTTAATSNITGAVNVTSGATLNLGADLHAGNIDVENTGSVINANGHAISGISLILGHFDTQATTVTNAGPVRVELLLLDHGSTLTVPGGSKATSEVSLSNGSVLTVQQSHGVGLSLTAASPGLVIDSSSKMDLVFTSPGPGWDFRWADPSNGNWISTLQGLIASGQIEVMSPSGYSVVDRGGFTYIQSGAPVPEPSTLVLAVAGGVVTTIGLAWRRRRCR
jgi:hypothetical protein